MARRLGRPKGDREERPFRVSPFIGQARSNDPELPGLARATRSYVALFAALSVLLGAALLIQANVDGVVGDIAGIIAVVLLLIIVCTFWIFFIVS